MTLPVYRESTIGFDGEHHMGADHVEFIPSDNLLGVGGVVYVNFTLGKKY